MEYTQKLADTWIKNNRFGQLAKELDRFESLSRNVARVLIAEGFGSQVARNIKSFDPYSHNGIAKHLIRAKLLDQLANNLHEFRELDSAVAKELILNQGGGKKVAYNLSSFRSVDRKEIALFLIHARQGFEKPLLSQLDKIDSAHHQEIANALIHTGCGELLIDYLPNFPRLDHNEIIDEFIDNRETRTPARRLDQFSGLNSFSAHRLISRGFQYKVASNPNSFSELTHIELAKMLIYSGNSSALSGNLDKYRELDNSIADRLLARGHKREVAENLKSFVNLLPNKASELIRAGFGNEVAENIRSFNGLDSLDVARELIAQGFVSIVIERPELFDGVEVFQAGEKSDGTEVSVIYLKEDTEIAGPNVIIQTVSKTFSGRTASEAIELVNDYLDSPKLKAPNGTPRVSTIRSEAIRAGLAELPPLHQAGLTIG